MSTLVQAMEKETNGTYTLNGMPVNKSSLDAHVDLFYSFGANRNNPDNVMSLFQKAYHLNEDLAVRIALYGRDIRGGMGEREHFRNILRHLAQSGEYYTVTQLIEFVPIVGRWDDLFALVNTPLESQALSFYAEALRSGNALAAKWCPREKSAKSHIAKTFRKFMGLSERQYRKLLVSLTDVIESDMCAGNWNEIDYNHVPSLASIRYQKAFHRNDGPRYMDYLSRVESGEAKINAGAVYPHQVIQSVRDEDSRRAAEQQWKALPDYIPEGKSFIPMVDVSGSMYTPVSNGITALDISVALGLYCSMKAKGPFEGKMLTFSGSPEWIDVSGMSLYNAVNTTERANWGFSTNIESAYRLILDAAVNNKVSQSDMPDYLIIFSDMQFNTATNNRGISKSIERSFEKAGYDMPRIVYWNLVDYGRNTHVTFNQEGSALVSGFSPSTMKAVLSDVESFTPINVVLETVMTDRYDWQKTA